MRCKALAVGAFCLLICGHAGSLFGQQRFAGWGALVDPDGDCAAKVENGRLTFTIVGHHDINDDVQRIMNAPRVLQEIEGDFVALIKVGGEFKPAGPSTWGDGRPPYNGGGLLIWQDEKNYIRLERGAIQLNGQIVDFLNLHQQKDGRVETNRFELRLKRERAQLRLERRNGRLYTSATYDHQVWQGYPPLEAELPGKLEIGVAAVSTSAAPLTPEFSEFELYRRAPPDPGEAVHLKPRP